MPAVSVQVQDFGVPKAEQFKVIQDAVKHHIESFNFVLNEGLHTIAENIPPIEMGLANGDRVKIQLRNCRIGIPAIKKGTVARTYKIFPAECRGRHVTYRGPCQITVAWSLNGTVQEIFEKTIGEVPIMVKSQACNLNKLKPKQLVEVGEEENEFGGYFIINGLEKVVRLLIAQRRNYPIAMQRNGWKKRGDLFTEYGVAVRCVKNDQSGNNLVLHFLSDGTIKLMFTYKRELFLVPVMIILKALVDEPDYYLYQQLIRGKENDSFYQESIKNMLRKVAVTGVYFQEQALNYLGEKFAIKLGLPSWYTNVEIAKFLIEQSICIHLDKPKEKFNFLVFMIQKLFSVVKKECALESPDSLMNQEVLTPGHLYLIVLKEKLAAWLLGLRLTLEKKLKSSKTSNLTKSMMSDCINKNTEVTRQVEHVFSTGNFLPRYENSLQQNSGLVIVGDKLNFWRYLSHFRAVHRGAFFAQMRTTAVRKLLPEAWGFLCPVHTPDGTPCGLLNHMSAACQVVNDVQPNKEVILNILYKYGVIPTDDPFPTCSQCYAVLCDGCVVGFILDKMAHTLVSKLRSVKVNGEQSVPKHIEICFIAKTEHASQFPGIFIFTTPSRMIRPVKNLILNKEELIGTMEQVYLHVALTPTDIMKGITVHEEIAVTNVLSILANQIPYSDFNQSPRNMYECQMGKQTMGTPCHALRYRADNKLYHIRTPQSPLVRPKAHDYYHMDEYPLGTNAIVAVISYTGYDMEDAIVLNKSSVERGFKHASIYKTELVNLRTIAGDKGTQKTLCFGRGTVEDKVAGFVDVDGLPYVGTRLKQGDPICCYVDTITGNTTTMKYKSTEEAYIDDVMMLGNDSGTDTNQQIAIKYRVPRNPVIGDKFASRHGQKGICSLMLPQEDLPFTESGITPDLIFNPHGFPSRMTIGMMIESMAGKSASTSGVLHDCTPFTFSEKDTAVSYFAECLKNVGFDYYGTERMYSGVSGHELEVDIFFGVIYYQRLRHMVSDKFQVRTTGPINPLTRQPVKGRKREGGVRFGEMERDALIAHGSTALLHDRLFWCSDASQQYVCCRCRDLLSPLFKPQDEMFPSADVTARDWVCKVCGSSENVVLIDIPYVFRYLCAELAAMNIKTNLEIGEYT